MDSPKIPSRICVCYHHSTLRYGGVVELSERDDVADKEIGAFPRFRDDVVHSWATAANSTHVAGTRLMNVVVVVVVGCGYVEERWRMGNTEMMVVRGKEARDVLISQNWLSPINFNPPPITYSTYEYPWLERIVLTLILPSKQNCITQPRHNYSNVGGM